MLSFGESSVPRSLTIRDLNPPDRPAFVGLLGGVFEHSPWVAERAWEARPFASAGELHRAMIEVVREAAREEQLALLRAHPVSPERPRGRGP